MWQERFFVELRFAVERITLACRGEGAGQSDVVVEVPSTRSGGKPCVPRIEGSAPSCWLIFKMLDDRVLEGRVPFSGKIERFGSHPCCGQQAEKDCEVKWFDHGWRWL